MKTIFVIFAALMVCYAMTLVESGYLVTSPRIFRAGSTQRLSVSLFSVSTPWDVNATVVYNNRRGAIASDEGKFTSLSDGFLNLKIPKDLNAGRKKSIKAKLMVTGRPVGGKQVFRKSEEITIEIPKKALFIQTDKPIYKPGQTVNMRIVGTDESLRPLTGKISRVTITNPSRVRNMQWDNLDFNFGIISLKFPLSSQPVLGDWKIEALFQGEKKTLVFKVDKYVLPKFEVTITPPSFVAYTDRSNITATVCARYTYGQPVKGKVKVLFKLKVPYWYRRWDAQTTKEKEINGCTEVSVSPGGLFRIRKGNGYPYYLSNAKVVINATVTETATGVTLNATETETQVVRETTKVEFLSTTPTSFKPGMAFTGQLKATLIDGSPLKGKSIELIVKIPIERPYWYSRYSQQEVFRKKYTVPENGVINFVVPGKQISQRARSLTLEANYNGKRASSYNVGQRWFSPSNSYIEMEKITAPLKVGSSAKIMFDFTTSNDTRNINFHLQVFSRGKLVAQERKLHPVDYQRGMKTFKNSKNEDMFTSQSFIEFNVTQKMVPKCRVLLFYVRDDQNKETVADNLVIDVEDTLENKVNLRFADNVRKPGENTRIIITAAPGSQVALAAVDKSVYLLKGGNQLTTDDAINVLSSQDVGSSGNYQSDCIPDFWRRRPRQRRRVLPMFGGRKPLDASKAFKESGVIYFSDLGIQTARCEKGLSYYTRRWRPVAVAGDPSGGGGFMVSSRRRFRPRQPQLPRPTDSGRQPSKKQNKSRQKPGYVRKEFAETWLWSEELVNDVTGKAVVMAKVPDTITSWIASAFAMSNSSGLGVSKPATLKVFQSFFVSLTLPYSVIRGEEVSIIATVFNYESKCLTIRLGLGESLHYRILSNSSFDVCVCSSEAKSVRFSIIPKKLGQMPLKVVAKDVATSACEVGAQQMTLGVTDAVIRKLLVEPEGVRQEYTYNSFVCLKDESYFNDTIKIALPSNVVAGSVYAVVSTVGETSLRNYY
ncbi:A-macroglobulin receptor [Porites harrisoni]